MTTTAGNRRGETPSTGQIVTFYSYKGGSGRTMTVANLAWILASNGYRVLAVDWDLESPGLHRYFHPFLLDKQLRASPGVIDMIRDFAAATLEPNRGDETLWFDERAQVLNYATSLDWTFRKPGGIDLLPAGRQDRSYAKAVSTFDWPSFYDRLGGGAFIDALARNMRLHYDYVLIDSRTGLSDAAGICTVELPDVVVNCFTLNIQSVEGAAAVARSIVNQRDRRPVRILPVLMRVEDAEQIKLEAGRDYARHEFASFLTHLTADEANRYWGDIEVPYKPFFAYEEILAPFAERPRLESSLLAAFERLTNVLTDGLVQEMPAMDERLRRQWLYEFERPRPTTASDVLVSYTAVDRMWAEWIMAELGDAGLRVVLHDIDFAVGQNLAVEMERILATVGRTLVLLSSEYVSSPQALPFWRLLDGREAAGAPSLVPIRLDNMKLSVPFTERIPVDLVGASADRAREALLGAVGSVSQGGLHAAEASHRGPRFPALLPTIWNVPQRNATFTGRSSTLEQLRDRLSANVTVVLPQALYGLGGVGKTQVAIEYAHRFAANYDLCWWISAEQPHLIRSSLAELGSELHLQQGESINDSVRIVRDALRLGRPYNRWLLIFDNVDEPEDVRDFIPQGAGHVLLTSRNQAWNREARAVEISAFTRDESVTFLTRRVAGLDRVDADVVADRLGDLPLAVEQAAAWLSATGMPVSRYLELLETQPLRILEENAPPGYEQTTARTWLLSLDRLRDQTPAAAKLLEVCAFFAPEPIPVRLLYTQRFTDVLLPSDPTLRDPIRQGRLVREIGRYALATIDSKQTAIQVHRLVQAVIQNSLDHEDRLENRRHVHEILAAAERGDPDEWQNWPTYGQLWPHVRSSEAQHSANTAVRLLLTDMVRYLWSRGDFSSSQELATDTLAVWRRTIGEDAYTLLLDFHLGNALRSQADYEEAYRVNEHALVRLKEIVGEDDPYTVMTAGGLAADLRALGRYEEARVLAEDALERAKRAFGEDHDRTLLAANNLAVSLRLVGDFASAANYDEDTYTKRRRIFGERHLNTLLAANNYAHDLRAIGKFEESRKLLEATIVLYLEVLDESQPATLRAAKNMAVTLRKIGDFQAANKLTMETLERYQNLHGMEHPDTLSCLMNRAFEESAIDNHAAAQATARVVLEGYEQLYGADHPFRLAALNNLAIFTRLSGQHGEAHGYSVETHDRFGSTLGPRHPYTLSRHINLANVLFDMKQFEDARHIDEQVWRMSVEVLGAENPDTLAAAANLVVSLRTTGDLAGARALNDETFSLSQRTLGDGHPNTMALRDGRRLNCDISPPPT